ncbi:uncharacterized protein LOC120667620 [Panicum virgatum]|uniref:DUF7086 domain-containing protein n=1 Tax=Panicum virgatum TaxID=38727 RepID=A0A8T0U659_PANVG|nr:uncharacterized protein LOC120667620 [Panicum virgatum]KAG2617757.1 hypothetical protein PVAP13_3NG183466 [Panicum virgatum]
MPWSKHYYSAADPPRQTTGGGGGSASGEAKGDDDSLLSLSLGDIYSRKAPAARATADAGGLRSPVVEAPMVAAAAPVWPADVLGPTSAAAAAAVHYPPLRFDALVGESSGAFPAASTVPALARIATMLFPRDGNGVVPAPAGHGDGDGDGTPPAASTKRPAKRSRSGRRRSSATSGHSGAGASAHAAKQAGDDDATIEVEGGRHVVPPYPWSTERVGVHHSLAELSRRGVEAVTGELQCKRCHDLRVVTLDARARFNELHGYISRNVQAMDDRAPRRWKEPALPDCERCGQRGSMRPVIPADKHRINWVFLLLSEMLGVCTLEQLKHLCEHTHQHRTGAKDRVLYSTYMELCNQLLPNGLFDMEAERRKRGRPNIV